MLISLDQTDDMNKARSKTPSTESAERAGEKTGLETNLNIDEAVCFPFSLLPYLPPHHLSYGLELMCLRDRPTTPQHKTKT